MAGADPAPRLGDPKSARRAGRNLVLRVVSAVGAGAAGAGGSLGRRLAVCAVLGRWPRSPSVGMDHAGRRARPSPDVLVLRLRRIALAALVDWRGRPVVAILLIGLGALAPPIFAPRGRRLWIGGGIFYAGLLVLAPLLLRNDATTASSPLSSLFAVVWTTDIARPIVAGRAIGGPKLWPAISPNKTWSGAIAGASAPWLLWRWARAPVGRSDPWLSRLVALLLSAVAQGRRSAGILDQAPVRRQGRQPPDPRPWRADGSARRLLGAPPWRLPDRRGARRIRRLGHGLLLW